MVSTYDLKPAFQRLLRPIVGGLATIGATPNQITILALLLSMVVGVVIAIWPNQHTLLLLLPLVYSGPLSQDNNALSLRG